MKLSNGSLMVLKNFAMINPKQGFKSGSVIRTINDGSIFAEASLVDELPRNFCIYDMNKFLSCLSLFENPELEFLDNKVLINGGQQGKISFTYANEALVYSQGINPYAQKLKIPAQSNVPVEISADVLKRIMRATGILENTDKSFLVFQNNPKNLSETQVCIYEDNGGENIEIDLSAFNNFSITLTNVNNEPNKSEFIAAIPMNNIKNLLTDDYIVTISNGLASFKPKNHKVQYYIALDARSKVN